MNARKTSDGKPAKAGMPAPVAPVDKTRHLQVARVPGKSDDRMYADLVADGLVACASAAIRFGKPDRGDVSLTELVVALREHGDALNRGDLAAAERMLAAQAVALNAVFCEMSRRAALNMGEYLGATELYMRLALKAQSQSRATVETLANIKNAPVVYAKQANFSGGAPQQVLNGAGAFAQAGKPENAPTGLLTGASDAETVDAATEGATGAIDPWLATVGALNGAANDRGQGAGEDEPLSRRQTSKGRSVRQGAARVAGRHTDAYSKPSRNGKRLTGRATPLASLRAIAAQTSRLSTLTSYAF